MATTAVKKQTANRAPASKSDSGQQGKSSLTSDLLGYFREYAREKPEVAACWCLGIGFVLGWKLKPW